MKFSRMICCRTVILAAAGFLLCSCDEDRRRIAWSPDGQNATLLADTTLYLMDGVGQLSEPLLENVDLAEWVGEDQLLVLRHRSILWDETAEALEKATRQRILRQSGEFLSRSRSVEDPDRFEELVEEYPILDLLPCLLGEYRDETFSLLRRMGEEPDPEELEEHARLQVSFVELYQRAGRFLNSPRKVGNSFLFNDLFSEVGELRVSPDLRLASLTSEDGTDQGLWVLRLADPFDSYQLVSGEVATSPDWMPDSRSIVYLEETGGWPALGALTEHPLFAENGEFDPTEPRRLAVTLFHHQCRVRCLEDRRVLFAAPEMRLPSPPDDVPRTDQLFQFDPRSPGVVNRVLSSSALANLPDSISLFELSPNQDRILVAGEGTSTVHVVTLSGEHEVIQGKARGKLAWMPSWKGDDEICLVSEDDSGIAQVTLQTGENRTYLSRSWDDKIRESMTTARRQP